MRIRNAVVLLAFFGVLGGKGIECTSSQNLHNLLRHPHYADGHQHSIHSHSQTEELVEQRTKRVKFPTPKKLEELLAMTLDNQGKMSMVDIGSRRKSKQSTSFPSKKYNDAKSAPSYPTSSWAREPIESGAPSLGPWNRVAPVYKMNGYTVKSTSATKSSMTVEPAELPQELLEVRAANEHFVRMRSGAKCHLPRQQVVCVRDVYPEKEFLPRCTLLHRCTESAGCCEDDAMQCAPRAMQEVALHFYVMGDHRSSDVEKLLFVNHTECECQPKPTQETSPTIEDSKSSADEDTDLHKNVVDQYPQGDQKSPKCRPCPYPFSVRELEDGRCSCDCFDRHKPCIRVKRGRESLADSERRCVLGGQCNVPDCDYGVFDPDKARCPKRPDHEGFKAGEHGRRPHPNSRNPNHRWTYFERD